MNASREIIKVTIIIPVHNSTNTIKRCLESVINQTYSNVEILVIDDESTDDTLDKIRTFNDPRICVIKQKHSGVSVARNTGIRKSSGKYLMFLDSDDAIKRDAVERLVEHAKHQKDTIVRFCCLKIEEGKKEKEDLRQFAGKIFDTNNECDFKMLIKYFFGGGDIIIPCYSVVLFLERNFVIKNNLFFNDDLCMMEDMVFYLKLFRSGEKIYFLNEPLYLCYINDNSATRSRKNTLKMLDGAISSSDIILNDLGYRVDVANNCFDIIFKYVARSIYNGYKVNKELNDPRLKKIVCATSNKPKMNFFNRIYFKMARVSILKKKYCLLHLLVYMYRTYNIIMRRHI